MDNPRWIVGQVSYVDRMPPLPIGSLNEKQRKVAEELINGPRGGVKGPFIPMLRSPDLVDRLGKVGEYLRFGSSLQAKISEFVMLIVSREWTNQFEWAVHVPLALKNGIRQEIIDALADGRHPKAMAEDEEIAYEICAELSRTRSVCDTTYRRAVEKFGEVGLIDIATLYGYFVTVCAIMNLAHTPPPADTKVAPILLYPL
ncbi:MAG TPA: carboxymuconolactone decarboxylase family protein [Burkholderiales bacterium]|jgi:4-carboxymuconolactone decarboxylase|nr:carboxymuconolactone decarboxylase family protein [Burkholderiales bacterium]